MNRFIFFIIAILFFLGNFYIGKRFILGFERIIVIPYPFVIAILIGICALISLATFLLADKNIGLIIGKVGNIWLAIWAVGIVVFGLIEFLLKLVDMFRPISFQVRLNSFFIGIVLLVLLVSYGIWQAKQIKIVNYQVQMSHTGSHEKIKAVLISDVHLGYINDVTKMKKIVTKINQMNPDIVFISGDLFDGNYEALQEPEQLKKQFKRLSSTYGTYMCWGNHDAGATFDKMKTLVETSDITVLEDEVTTVADAMIIVGRKDSQPIGPQNGHRKAIDQALKNVDPTLPKIILDHQPSNLEEYTGENELILSGHTHKGQIFPFTFVTKAYFTVDYGYYRKDAQNPQIIVSSGVGTWGPPMRIGTQSEIVQIDIHLK